MRRCKHEKTVYVEGSCDTGVGSRAVVCRGCGAVEGQGRTDASGKPTRGYDGFGADLAFELDCMEIQGRSYPEGARFTILDEEPPCFAPGDVCEGYRLKGPRTVVYGTDRRPTIFVQRLDLPGGSWGRFVRSGDETKWYVTAYKTRTLAIKGPL